MFSKSSNCENESEYNANISMTQTIPKKKTKGQCYFNDRWKNMYSWIREVSYLNRAYRTICRKEFGVGPGREGGVKTHTETESYQCGMRQASTSESVQSVLVSPKDTSAR